MGFELYCGDKIGTVNLYSTVTDTMRRRNLTPKQIGNYMYKDTKESLEYFAKGTRKGSPILGQFFDNNKRVRNTKEDIEKKCNIIKRNWTKWAQEKVDECRLKGIKGEAVHQIEFDVNKGFTGRHRIMPPSSFIG